MKEDVLFKRTPFGGFDRVEVISYIQQLKATQQKYKLMIDDKDKAVAKLSSENDDLKIQVGELRKLKEENEKQLKDLEAEIETLKEELSNTKDDGGEYASQTVKMCDELVETASQTSKKIIALAELKLENAQKAVDNAVSELESKEKVTAKQAKDLLKKLQEELK